MEQIVWTNYSGEKQTNVDRFYSLETPSDKHQPGLPWKVIAYGSALELPVLEHKAKEMSRGNHKLALRIRKVSI